MVARGFIALNWLRQGHAGPPRRPDLPFARLLTALRLRPRRALSSAEAASGSVPAPAQRNKILPGDIMIPVLIAQGCPVLIAPRQFQDQLASLRRQCCFPAAFDQGAQFGDDVLVLGIFRQVPQFLGIRFVVI